ncbi:MAG: Uncharacterized protein G01um10147_165 [Microgenomates group bacterium Gr01-1014_7]|nr:MAG: Uncharacterized protein G01um10147_165 [Microgenomates group bacterium Gr01-1014_7]
MSKNLLFILALIIIILTAYFTLAVNSGLPKAPARNEVETAVNQAKHLFGLEKQAGRDFSSGPCLSNALLPGWVLDIAHNPRQAIDDLPENQCSSYREGRALHFVELDPEGNLIRAQ